MANVREQAQCVVWFIETKSEIQFQRNFRTTFNKDPPSRPSIRRWHKHFMRQVVWTSLIILVGLGRVKKTLSDSGRHFFVECCSEIPVNLNISFVSVKQVTRSPFSTAVMTVWPTWWEVLPPVRKTLSVTVSCASRTGSVTYIQYIL
jgi:hypothetical protein